jgi:hypothetical protein
LEQQKEKGQGTPSSFQQDNYAFKLKYGVFIKKTG